MRGSNVVRKKATQNYVIRSQFVAGTASFSDIQILDVHPGVRLNLTMFSSRFPYTRRPASYSDTASIVVYPWDTTENSVLFMNTSYQQDPAVFLTNSIQIIGNERNMLTLNPLMPNELSYLNSLDRLLG